jgi:hypothetical protein
MLGGCGGSTPAATTPTAPPASNSAAPEAPSAAPAASAQPAPVKKVSDEDDPNKAPVDMEMTVLLDPKTPKSAFPKSTLGDKACWQDIGLIGQHDKDYAQVVEKCGAPTGMLEYAKPEHGTLHDITHGEKTDIRDKFKLKIKGGLCYRFFAIADGTVEDMDILVFSKTGALIANDATKSPVAIIHSAKPWCVDDDTEYNFHLDIDAKGKGKYIFAVWARPK